MSEGNKKTPSISYFHIQSHRVNFWLSVSFSKNTGIDTCSHLRNNSQVLCFSTSSERGTEGNTCCWTLNQKNLAFDAGTGGSHLYVIPVLKVLKQENHPHLRPMGYMVSSKTAWARVRPSPKRKKGGSPIIIKIYNEYVLEVKGRWVKVNLSNPLLEFHRKLPNEVCCLHF